MDSRRVLDAELVADLDTYVSVGGGQGLEAARKLGPDATVDEVDAAGLRGRGGAGFPTARKWRAVLEHAPPPDVAATVVVNAAEGEPGSFKDRAILRANPYRVIEGALVAATASGASRAVVALKRSFTGEIERVRRAIDEVTGAGWNEGVTLEVLEGPGEYLYGEETALLEVLEGHAPFPRLAPPFRQGLDRPGEDAPSAAETKLATGDVASAPPALVNNTETVANLPGILAEGPAWFRSVGTDASPGTVVCTITGRVQRSGVGEFPMGTPLRAVIEALGGGPLERRTLVAALSGVAHPLLPEALFDTPLTYEDMEGAGGGLGAAGFIVFDDETDLAAVAAGVSRFLAVESCGQCTPCKQDGLAISRLLTAACANEGDEGVLVEIADRAATIADGARCYLATQHQRVVMSVLERFPDYVRAHLDDRLDRVAPEPVAPLLDLVDGAAVVDEQELRKQPDWSYGEEDSGQSPADRIDQAARERI